MPDRILQRAFDTKQADHNCIALWLALTMVEIKSPEEQISLLSTVHEQHNGDLAVSGAYLDTLNQALSSRSLAEVEENKQYYGNEHTAQLAALDAAQTHLSQIYDVVGLGCSRWLWGDNGGSKAHFSDNDSNWNDEDSADKVDSEDG